MKSKEELKKLFENGDRPTQKEFWEWQDSYWHKEEKLPTENEGNYRIKGSVANLDALNALTDMSQGDVYNLLNTGDNYVYVLDLNNTGETGWDKLSGMVDLSTINLQTVLNNGSRAVDQSTNSSILLDATSKIVNYNFTDLISLQSSFYQGLSSHVVQLINDNAYSIESIINSSNGLISMNVTDSNSRESKGFRFNNTSALHYNDDYSDIFNDRSLVDKGYVDSKISPVTLQTVLDNGGIANDGEFESSFTMDLENRMFTSYHNANQGGTSIYQDRNSISIGASNGIKTSNINIEPEKITVSNDIYFDEEYEGLRRENTDEQKSGFIGFEDGNSTMSTTMTENGFASRISTVGNSIEIGCNDPNSRGLVASNDFSANVQELDYVQKKYVDNKPSNAILQTVLDNSNYAQSSDANQSVSLDIKLGQFGTSFNGETSSTSINQTKEALYFIYNYGSGDFSTQVSLKEGGLEYFEDYSQRPEFGNRNLVDKRYVDNAIASSGNYIPLMGTKLNEKVTGNIEFENFKDLFWIDNDGVRRSLSFQDGALSIYAGGDTSNYEKEIQINAKYGITGAEDYSSNYQELDFVQKKYVDTIVSQNSISDEVILTHQMTGSASYKKIGDFAYLNLNLFGRADANGKSLADANQSGFGNLNKIIPVMASDDTVKFIRLRGVDHSPGLTITKANLSDDDFDFTINDVLLVSFAGFVPL